MIVMILIGMIVMILIGDDVLDDVMDGLHMP